MNHLKKDTLRLAATYLAIIMVMSIIFSLVLFAVSAHELERRPRVNGPVVFEERVMQRIFDERARESRSALAINLVIINVVTLVVGGCISYLLAEKTLRPIEDNMAAQLQFVSDASHELRTPLTALRTANEVALRNKSLKLSQAKHVLEENVVDIARLQTLTDSMLGLLRSDTGMQKEQVSLAVVINRSINHVAPDAIKKHIRIEDPTGDMSVRGDESQLVQLMTIILDNAIKYSSDNTTITISLTRSSKWTMISIKDQGIGMDSATQQAIFTRFYRADSSRSTTTGYGLGLAIAKKIVDAHQGVITVDSSLGNGSTFTIKLISAN